MMMIILTLILIIIIILWWNLLGKILKYRSKLATIFDTAAALIHIYFYVLLRAALFVMFLVFSSYVASNHDDTDSPIFNTLIFITVYILLAYILQYSREIEQPFGNYIEDFPVLMWLDGKINTCIQFHAKQDQYEIAKLNSSNATSNENAV